MASSSIVTKLLGILTVKSAVSHWRYQRLSAVALVPLTFWLLLLLSKASHAPYAETLVWISSPLNIFALSAWTVAVIYHAALGVQVVLEDYVSQLAVRHTAINASNFIFISLGVAILATLIIIFTR
jgi:succinate dehydrogenase / fumarate reductase membrane anchor subunit